MPAAKIFAHLDDLLFLAATFIFGRQAVLIIGGELLFVELGLSSDLFSVLP
jgi:hypothetical protein